MPEILIIYSVVGLQLGKTWKTPSVNVIYQTYKVTFVKT